VTNSGKRPAIHVEGLRFRYDGAEVLHGISFDILAGEVTGLLGPNGAGKSTTLKILTGILKAPEGIAEVEGYKLPQEAFEVKKRIGYVPESSELYESLSAVEFLELCGRLHEVEEGILQARLGVFMETFGLSRQKRNRLGSYSKGMRQKVLISAALLHDPSVLILDEPLTGLDVESVMLTKSLLTALAANGKSVLYSSHVLDVVERFCARVLIIDQGKLIADGSPEELKTRTNEANLEGVFRGLTHAVDAEPRIRNIIDILHS
jgi:ABC-2 type transport system ATP-binding protein